MTQKAKISGFSIPRLQATEKQDGELLCKQFESRDGKELLDELSRRIHDHSSYSEWQLSNEVQFVHNRKLETEFREKKVAMKSEAPVGVKEIQETLAFLSVSDLEAKSISSKGISCGNQQTNFLGNKSMGVYLYRHVDVCLKVAATKLPQRAGVSVMVFKLALGKVKSVQIRAPMDDSLEPTPMYDCHVSQSRPSPNEKLAQLIPKTQIYIYEFDDDCLPVARPRQCLPFAVIAFNPNPPQLSAQSSVPPALSQSPKVSQPVSHSPKVPIPHSQSPKSALPPSHSPKIQPQNSTVFLPTGLAPIASPDRVLKDHQRLGAKSVPGKSILKGPSNSATTNFGSPPIVHPTISSPGIEDGQFSPNQETELEKLTKKPYIVPKFAPDHPKYKPWVEKMRQMGYNVEDLSKKTRRKRVSSSSKKHSNDPKKSEEERLQIKEMVFQMVDKMKEESEKIKSDIVLEKLEKMKIILPELLDGIALVADEGELEKAVEARIRPQLEEIMKSIKSESLNRFEDKASEDGFAVVEQSSLTDVSNGETTDSSATVSKSLVKDESLSEFKQLDKLIHSHYCSYYAEYSRLKEIRKDPDKVSKEEIETIENNIAIVQIEIEFLKHRVSQNKWPSDLYLTPREILLKGEEKKCLKYPLSEYQASKVKEINRYIYKNYKKMSHATLNKDFKVVDKIQKEIARFRKDRELTLYEVNMVPNMSSFSPGYDFDVVSRVKDIILSRGAENESQELFEKKINFIDGKISTLKLKKDREISIVRQPVQPTNNTVSEIEKETNSEKSLNEDMMKEIADSNVLNSENKALVKEPEKCNLDDAVRQDGVAWASPSVNENTHVSLEKSVPKFYAEAIPQSIVSGFNLPDQEKNAKKSKVEIFEEAPASPDCLSDHDSGIEAARDPDSEVTRSLMQNEVLTPKSENFTLFFNKLADGLGEVFTIINAEPGTTATPLPANTKVAFTQKIASVIAECGLENLQHLEAMSRLKGGGEVVKDQTSQPNNFITNEGFEENDEPPAKKFKDRSTESTTQPFIHNLNENLPPVPPPPVIVPSLLALPLREEALQPTIAQNLSTPQAYNPPSPPFFVNNTSSNFEETDSPPIEFNKRSESDIICYHDSDLRHELQSMKGDKSDIDEREILSIKGDKSDIDERELCIDSPGRSIISLSASDKEDALETSLNSVVVLSAPASPTGSEDTKGVHPDGDVDLRIIKHQEIESQDVDLRDLAVDIVDMDVSGDEEEKTDKMTNSFDKKDVTPTILECVNFDDDGDDPIILERQEIASPSPTREVADEAENCSEEGEIMIEEDSKIFSLDPETRKKLFQNLDRISYQLKKSYESLSQRLNFLISKKKSGTLGRMEERELEEVELKMGELYFEFKELKVEYDKSMMGIRETYRLDQDLLLPFERKSEFELTSPLSRWQKERLAQIKDEILQVQTRVKEFVYLSEFPLNLTNDVVNLKYKRLEVMGIQKEEQFNLIPEFKFFPSNPILTRLLHVFPNDNPKRALVEDEVEIRKCLDGSSHQLTSYSDFIELQQEAISIFKKCRETQVKKRKPLSNRDKDQIIPWHIQLATIKRKFLTLCSLEKEDQHKSSRPFGSDVPRGLPDSLSLKGDGVLDTPLSAWQLGAMEDIKRKIEELRSVWLGLTQKQKCERRGNDLLETLESYLNKRKRVIEKIVLVPNLPSVGILSSENSLEADLLSLIEGMRGASDDGSLQLLEELMNLIQTASDESGGYDHQKTKIELSKLLFWDDTRDNAELSEMNVPVKSHRQYYGNEPLVVVGVGRSSQPPRLLDLKFPKNNARDSNNHLLGKKSAEPRSSSMKKGNEFSEEQRNFSSFLKRNSEADSPVSFRSRRKELPIGGGPGGSGGSGGTCSIMGNVTEKKTVVGLLDDDERRNNFPRNVGFNRSLTSETDNRTFQPGRGMGRNVERLPPGANDVDQYLFKDVMTRLGMQNSPTRFNNSTGLLGDSPMIGSGMRPVMFMNPRCPDFARDVRMPFPSNSGFRMPNFYDFRRGTRRF